MISTKYIPALCVVMVFPLVPTFIHNYAGATVTDSRALVGTLTSVPGYRASVTTRHAAWGKENFDSDDWIERRYVSKDDDVVLTVVRSFNPKTLYHHPELACAYGTPFHQYETRRFQQHPDIPVHVLRSMTGRGAVAMYVLHYGDQFVEHPIRFQIRTAGELLFSPRKPMTLFFVHDLAAGVGTEVERRKAVSLLLGAVDQFLSTPPQ